jgi:hypothetical protein
LKSINKLKIINDPIYGFISIPSGLIFDLIQHPYFQRLRRISQMGLSYLVYPGAHHTRFHHALGCMHIMQKAIDTLRSKGIVINEKEAEGLLIAILLHDIGHGPFSHAMEHSIVEDINHEKISGLFMHQLNKEFGGALNLAIQIFTGQYPRTFFLQLISSQIDMDRMDYLKRDSFYSGVAEGNINSDRLIQMLQVHEDKLVIEEKGIYSIEKFLMARRLMYWQTYLHKTGVAAEVILTKVLKRAKHLTQKGLLLQASTPLRYFLENKIDAHNFENEILHIFSQLDDFDIVSALKSWMFHQDFILSKLSSMIINRDLPKIMLSNHKFENNYFENLQKQTENLYKIDGLDLDYFVFKGKIKNQAYHKKNNPIQILRKNKTVSDVIQVSDQLNAGFFSKPVTKYYICFPKDLA